MTESEELTMSGPRHTDRQECEQQQYLMRVGAAVGPDGGPHASCRATWVRDNVLCMLLVCLRRVGKESGVGFRTSGAFRRPAEALAHFRDEPDWGLRGYRPGYMEIAVIAW